MLFDEGHGQRFLAGGTGDLQLSGLADLLRAEGGSRSARPGSGSTRGPSQGVGAVIISGAFAPLDATRSRRSTPSSSAGAASP